MTDQQNKIPAIVLGGTGYVSGELLRLIVGHPNFTLAGVMTDSTPGELAGKSFPHLAGVLGNTAFKSQADIAALIAKEPVAQMLGSEEATSGVKQQRYQQRGPPAS